MIELLLIIIIVLILINIIATIFKKNGNSIDSKLLSQEIGKVTVLLNQNLEKLERSFKDEFQRNRLETNEYTKDILSQIKERFNDFSIQQHQNKGVLEKQLLGNKKEINEILREKFGDLLIQQEQSSKQLVNSVKEINLEIKISFEHFNAAFSTKINGFGETLKDQILMIGDQQNEFNKQLKENSRDDREDINNILNVLKIQSDDNRKEINHLLREKFEDFSIQQHQIKKDLKGAFSDFGFQFSTKVKELTDIINDKFTMMSDQQSEFNRQISEGNRDGREDLNQTLNSLEGKSDKNRQEINTLLKDKFGHFSTEQHQINTQLKESIKEIKSSVESNLNSIREDNSRQLSEMRNTVDDKLQTTLERRLGESFKQVSERLEQVHKGLGEMQTIATGVGDLKKVLSNVKTRGILGEYQLERILDQMLTPDQYSKNVATKRGSQVNVEFALKLPGNEAGKEIWMPIDSKFPIEDYQLLLDAFEKGDKKEIEQSQKLLLRKIEGFAKDISDKYIDPPHTTDFGIMFLPVEGLYSEVLRYPGLFETLQRKYKITITGPTTLSAFLNSLQMGFRTLAIQKRSSEVWDLLKSVKFEFGKFSEVLSKVNKQLNTVTGTLETLRTTRTNVLERKLRDVEILTAEESEKILNLSETSSE